MSDRLKVTAQYLIPKQALTVLAGKLESEQSHSAALAALLARLNLVAGSEGEGGEPSA